MLGPSPRAYWAASMAATVASDANTVSRAASDDITVTLMPSNGIAAAKAAQICGAADSSDRLRIAASIAARRAAMSPDMTRVTGAGHARRRIMAGRGHLISHRR